MNDNDGMFTTGSVLWYLYSAGALAVNIVLSIDGDAIGSVIAYLVGLSAITKNVIDMYFKFKNKTPKP